MILNVFRANLLPYFYHTVNRLHGSEKKGQKSRKSDFWLSSLKHRGKKTTYAKVKNVFSLISTPEIS